VITVKDHVYSTEVTSVQNLKEFVVCAVEKIPPEVCVRENVFLAFEYPMDIAQGAQVLAC
jgi:hypothetical protein